MVDIRSLLAEYISQERDILIGLLVDILGVFAGFTATFLLPYQSRVGWILLIFPILLTVRGALNGAFCGRLTTSLHIGSILPSFLKNTEEYYSLIASILFLGVVNGFIATLVVAMFTRVYIQVIVSLLVIPAVFIITSLFSIILTSLAGFFTFKTGLDPDKIVYPVMSTINDIAISAILLGIIIFLQPWDILICILRGIPFFLVLIIPIGCVISKFRKSTMFRKTIIEAYLGILFSLAMSSFAGMLLTLLEKKLGILPGVLAILPAIMDTNGDIGSIIVSTITTKLHLGELDPDDIRGISIMMLQLLALIIPPLMGVVVILAILGSLLTRLSLVDTIFLSTTYLYVTMTASLIITVLSVMVAILTFRFGIDPDNVSIPILTATADLLTITLVYIILS